MIENDINEIHKKKKSVFEYQWKLWFLLFI